MWFNKCFDLNINSRFQKTRENVSLYIIYKFKSVFYQN